MYNKNIFKQVRELGLPVGKYVIFGSGPMRIRKIRECHDADIIVLEEIWEEIKNNPD